MYALASVYMFQTEKCETLIFKILRIFIQDVNYFRQIYMDISQFLENIRISSIEALDSSSWNNTIKFEDSEKKLKKKQ